MGMGYRSRWVLRAADGHYAVWLTGLARLTSFAHALIITAGYRLLHPLAAPVRTPACHNFRGASGGSFPRFGGNGPPAKTNPCT